MLSPPERLNIAPASGGGRDEAKRQGVVVALGGNALAPPEGSGSVAEQFEHTRESLGVIVDLARDGGRIAIVHGNGPQVGYALLRNEAARDVAPPLPLSLLVASTAGWIGYMIQQTLENALQSAGIERRVATVITQVLVDAADPELGAPSKPIGRTFDGELAQRLVAERGWDVASGPKGWRRVVPSPYPVGIVEGELIESFFDKGAVVIAAGGGGIPVYRSSNGTLEGIDAVIDKDRAATVLGTAIGAEALLILTDVEGIYEKFGTERQRLIRTLEIGRAERMLADGELHAGSMAPKLEAAVRFVREGGRRAVISRLDLGREAMAGEAGTEIIAG